MRQEILAPWATASRPSDVGRGGSTGLYKGPSPYHRPPQSFLQTFGFQPFEALVRNVSKFSSV
jgi:hypothetical protein